MLMSQLDHSRLVPLVTAALSTRATPLLDALDEILAEATLVAPTEVPGDLVTMNSEVCFELPRGSKSRQARLVYAAPRPNDDGGVVSVFSPLGLALLGARVGATVALGSGATDRALHVSGLVYQPEASGDWEL